MRSIKVNRLGQLALILYLLGTAPAWAFFGGPGSNVQSGDFDAVKQAAESEDVTSKHSFNGMTYLIAVIRNPKLSNAEKTIAIDIMLERGADIDEMDSQGNAPLMHAVLMNNRELASHLLDKGADVDTTNIKGETPYSIALKNRQQDIVELTVAAGAYTDTRNVAGRMPIEEAVINGDSELTKQIIDSDRDPETQMTNALIAAAMVNNAKLVRYLISERHADVNAKNIDGLAPLHSAAAGGHMDLVTYLLEQGAHINTSGFTPLMAAATAGQLRMVRFLTEAGADINASTITAHNALYQAVSHGHWDTAEYLSRYGAHYPAIEDDREPFVAGMMHYYVGKQQAKKGGLESGISHMQHASSLLENSLQTARSAVGKFQQKREGELRTHNMTKALSFLMLSQPGTWASLPGSTQLELMRGATRPTPEFSISDTEESAQQVMKLSKTYAKRATILMECYKQGGATSAIKTCIKKLRRKSQ